MQSRNVQEETMHRSCQWPGRTEQTDFDVGAVWSSQVLWSISYMVPEPAFGITKTMFTVNIEDWVQQQQKNYWDEWTRMDKRYIKDLSKNRKEELLKLSRKQVKIFITQ